MLKTLNKYNQHNYDRHPFNIYYHPHKITINVLECLSSLIHNVSSVLNSITTIKIYLKQLVHSEYSSLQLAQFKKFSQSQQFYFEQIIKVLINLPSKVVSCNNYNSQKHFENKHSLFKSIAQNTNKLLHPSVPK